MILGQTRDFIHAKIDAKLPLFYLLPYLAAIYFTITLANYQIATLANYQIATLANYQIITLANYQIITLAN